MDYIRTYFTSINWHIGRVIQWHRYLKSAFSTLWHLIRNKAFQIDVPLRIWFDNYNWYPWLIISKLRSISSPFFSLPFRFRFLNFPPTTLLYGTHRMPCNLLSNSLIFHLQTQKVFDSTSGTSRKTLIHCQIRPIFE